MSVQGKLIERWSNWLVGTPTTWTVTWLVFLGWLALGFLTAGVIHGAGWLIRRRGTLAKKA